MKKKDFLWSLLALVMVVMLGLEFSSCSKDDTDDELEQTEFISAQDPEGTIVLNMNSGASDNYYNIGNLCDIHIDEANNFKARYNGVSFVSVGLVSGLGKITQIPTSGWANSAAVVPGTGYVLRCNGQYARIYVVEYLGQSFTDEQGNTYGTITGAKIKYQAPLQQEINLESNSLTFSNKGDVSKTVKLKFPTYLSVKQKPEWCRVTAYVDSVCVTVSENLGEERKGDIILSNVYGEATISLVQNAISSISFEKSTITFNSEASSQTVKLKSPTSAELQEKPEWSSVQITSEAITVSVMENVSASQRTGQIVIKNNVGSASLTITQKASSNPLFEKGMGTADAPYEIKTAQQLVNISKCPDYCHFVIVSDIDLKSYIYEYGNGWEPINNFIGTLDGKGHKIKGLWIKRPSTGNIGLFGVIYASISNLKVEIDERGIIGGSQVGAISGQAYSSNIYNCSVNGNISGNYVGGLCGYINNCVVESCSVTGTITGTGNGGNEDCAGGICGESSYTKIKRCSMMGKITGSSGYLGGICGYDNTTRIEECRMEGEIISSKGKVGGINAYHNNDSYPVINCYSSASLSGSYAYGISSGGTITKCYFAGKVSVTQSFSCTGSYTYFDSTVSGQSGSNGFTTNEMMKQSTYEGWDFTSIWKITEGKTYPALRCFDK